MVKTVVNAHVSVLQKVHKAQWSLTKRALSNQYVASVVQIVGCGAGPIACVAISAVVTSIAAYAVTGDWSSALRAGATAAATTYVSMVVADVIGKVRNPVYNSLLHGVSGASMAKIQGGSARSGFMSGLMSAAAKNSMAKDGVWREGADSIGRGGRTAVSVMVGAATAKATGGDVAQAAFNSAVAHLYNAEPHTRDRSCSGQMCRRQLYENNSKLFQSADLSLDGQVCAGPCIGGEFELSKDHGMSTTVKSGFGLKASAGAGSDISIITFGEAPQNGTLSTMNYISGQIGPAGITINHYAWPDGSQWSFELNLRLPGGAGANGGTGVKKW